MIYCSSTLADLAAALAPHAEQIAEHLTGTKPTSRSGREIRFGKKGSLAIVISGAERGSFFDHQAGEGGDGLGLVARLRRSSIADAAAWARAFLGIDGTTPPRPAPKAAPAKQAAPPEDMSKTAEALAIWYAAQESIFNTPADVYLRGRGLDPMKMPPHAGIFGWPPTLRFHSGIGALIVGVNDAKFGVIGAIQRIFLNQDGTPKRRPDGRKIKLALGPTGNGNATHFAWQPDPQGRWGIAEGAETALAAAQLLRVPFAACLGASNMAKVVPPSWAISVAIFADHDDAGMDAAQVTRQAMKQRGLHVRVIRDQRPGADAADLLKETQL